jgi:hypothetical protein
MVLPGVDRAGAGIVGPHRDPGTMSLYQVAREAAKPGRPSGSGLPGLVPAPGWQVSVPMLRSMEISIDGPRGGSEAKEDPVITRIYEGHGVRFEYPSDWDLEESDEGEASTVEVQAPGGLAFALVRSDESGPDPATVADEVLEAMREEYPELDVTPAMETIAGHHATGYDIEFFSLDFTNGAAIRCFRTPVRTVLAFGQWSDIGAADLPDLIRQLFRSVDETED